MIFPDLRGLVDVAGPDQTILKTCGFGSAPFRELAVGEADPVARIARTKANMDTLKQSPEAAAIMALFNLFGRAPKFVEDLAVEGDGHGLGGVDDPTHVLLVDHAVLVGDGDHAPRVEALDVGAGDADVGGADLHPRHELGLFLGLLDGRGRGLEVDDDALAQAPASNVANAKNLDAIRVDLKTKTGREYWRSLEELADTPEFQELLQREYPRYAAVIDSGMTRRQFLKLLGASLALAGLTGCGSAAAREAAKAVAAAQKILSFNTGIEVESRVADLTPANVKELLDGAELILDGTDTGVVTPATLKNVATGSHTIQCTKTGYTSASQGVTVQAGRTATVKMTLQASTPSTGTISVSSASCRLRKITPLLDCRIRHRGGQPRRELVRQAARARHR